MRAQPDPDTRGYFFFFLMKGKYITYITQVSHHTLSFSWNLEGSSLLFIVIFLPPINIKLGISVIEYMQQCNQDKGRIFK